MTGLTPLRELIGVVGDACFIVDAETRIAAANEPARRMFGDGLEGRPLTDVCADESSADTMVATVTSCNGHECSFTTRARKADGSIAGIDVTAKRCHGIRSDHALLVIRELRRKLDTCEAHLELQSLLLDETSDGIVAHTLDGLLVHANRAALEQWNLTFEEARSRGPFGWVHQSARESVAKLMTEIVEHGEARFDSRAQHPDGTEFPVEIHARVVDSPLGTLVVSGVRDVSERARSEEMVRYLAYHDTLTGLANRVMLDSALHEAIVDAKRHGDVVGVIFLDLNDFKPVNDTHGHAVGDNVLREVADRIAECVRENDTVARLGGDEFVVVLPRLVSQLDLPAIARKIDRAVRAPMLVSGHEICVSGTIGMALYEDGDDPDGLLTKADLNMYEAREVGAQGWDVLSSGMTL